MLTIPLIDSVLPIRHSHCQGLFLQQYLDPSWYLSYENMVDGSVEALNWGQEGWVGQELGRAFTGLLSSHVIIQNVFMEHFPCARLRQYAARRQLTFCWT